MYGYNYTFMYNYVLILYQITRRERDMAMRNSELSFRIRTLEDNITILKEQKHSLVGLLHLAASCILL